MQGSMDPPLPQNPSHNLISDTDDTVVGHTSVENEAYSNKITGSDLDDDQEMEKSLSKKQNPSLLLSPKSSSNSSSSQQNTVPYTIPPWSEIPEHPFSLEVIKDGTIIEKLDVSEKGAYMFGRLDLCDFVLEHPTISRFHAVLQFRKGGAYLYDLGSTHGTFVNKNQIKGKMYVDIHVGDVLRFGQSSRLYVFEGPSELMLPEGDLQKIRKAKIQESMHDCEASLLRAKDAASLANGISWGMAEDAVEEDPENEADEITWQTYKGQLTERQDKIRSKILKRMEKVSNMKKEIDAIRAKDISQGGLTQGQQMQIGRNEQRISQIMEELDSLEETLNDSIHESMGARSRKSVGGKTKLVAEEEEDPLSDDDEFYDRTKKPTKSTDEHKSVETADSLLEKMDVFSGKIEEKRKVLEEEIQKIASNEKTNNGGDDLDTYMIDLASQLVIDMTIQKEKEIAELQVELDRVTYLLKIADPSGDAAQKRVTRFNETRALNLDQSIMPSISGEHCDPSNENPSSNLDKFASKPSLILLEKPSKKLECNKEDKKPAFTIAKPQWLGAMRKAELEEERILPPDLDSCPQDDFVDYRDRKKFLAVAEDDDGNLETAAPGLIIRKRKPVERAANDIGEAPRADAPSSPKAEAVAADAVALLLKHKRGIHVLDEELTEGHQQGRPGRENPHPRRVFGPARPNFLDNDERPDYSSWVPPEGQTGDGRTSLNDRLGY